MVNDLDCELNADTIKKAIIEFLKEKVKKITTKNCCCDTREKIDKNYKYRIYNEISLQHELGLYLRNKFNEENAIVLFEKNVKSFDGGMDVKDWVKFKIDIVIIDKRTDKKYAIELKFPINGQYPAQMFQFIKDIRFMEQVNKYLHFDQSFCLTLVNDSSFYSYVTEKGTKTKPNDNKIYQYFRNEKNKTKTIEPGLIEDPIIHAKQDKPKSPKPLKPIHIAGKYKIKWESINNCSKIKYYLLEIEKLRTK